MKRNIIWGSKRFYFRAFTDMFYFLEDFDNANYADNSTNIMHKNTEFVVNNLEQLSSFLFKWLNDSYT